MTIKNLIEILKQYPDDMQVKISATYDCGYGRAGGNIEYIKKDEYENNAIILCNDEE